MMKKILKVYKSMLKVIEKIELNIGIALLSIITILILIQVLLRYIFGKPLFWIEEICIYAFIWAAFIGASYVFKYKRHIQVKILTEILSSKMKDYMNIFVYICVIFFLAFILPLAYQQFHAESLMYTQTLPIKISRKYFYSLPFLYSCFSILITSIYFFLEQVNAIISSRKLER